ncbi:MULTISPECIES: glutathione S-transferase [unclassified Beijerinckia]|uniref:glutathione S-transferase family protein n=1 Tax=unclassified Beijerinckia TaxID=2638183 RepID=UPI0008968EB4|nr:MULTISPECIES: glutathione S-transferase [unclassified Beijerinckia]MDH7796192.1 glutathione S-transferase [Beijerinckia sp. GAS462]SEC34335.1 glutathione S-transferase [Beijerinckia sp. 28-YEA-48]
MKLYHHPLSGHSHRARLFCTLADIPLELVELDVLKGAHKSADYLKLNRFGQVPLLDDGGVLIPDSNAIMVYLAKKFGRSDWLPEEAIGAAAVQRWLSVAAGQIAFGPAAARLVTVFGAKFNAEEVVQRAHGILRLLDAELQARDWLAAARPTIADIALYSYVARAPEGNVDLSPYGHVAGWLERIEALPGFVPFQETAIGLAAVR